MPFQKSPLTGLYARRIALCPPVLVLKHVTNALEAFFRAFSVFAMRGIFGKKRWAEFRRVLREEDRGLSWRDRAELRWGMLRSALGMGVSRRVWRDRMRICRECPLFDSELKRCRPYSGHDLGCGCYVPWLALVKAPYPSGCWGKEHLPEESGIGWKSE